MSMCLDDSRTFSHIISLMPYMHPSHCCHGCDVLEQCRCDAVARYPSSPFVTLAPHTFLISILSIP
jgi:hypothetical protein